MDTIKCLLCNGDFKILGQHLRSKHNVTSREYTSMYPGEPLVSDSTRAKLVAQNIAFSAANPDMVLKRALAGGKATKERKESDPEFKVATGVKIGVKLKETFSDSKYKEFFANKGVQLNAWKAANPDESSKVYSANLLKWKLNPANAATIRAHSLKNFKAWGNKIPALKNKYGIESVKSKLERWALYITNRLREVTSIVYEPLWIPVLGRPRGYMPDFIVNDKYIIEVKPASKVLDEDVVLKAESARIYAASNNMEYVIITEDNIFYDDKRTKVSNVKLLTSFLKIKV